MIDRESKVFIIKNHKKLKIKYVVSIKNVNEH